MVHRPDRQMHLRGSLGVLVGTMVMVSMLPGCLQEDSGVFYSVVFSFISSASGPSEVYVPVPEYHPLLDRLKLKDGKGGFELVDTPHGRCMRVTYDSFIYIRAKVLTSHASKATEMTANLTTMEGEVVDGEYRDFWCNVTSETVDDFVVRISMEKNSIYTKYYYNSINSDNITTGWRLYRSEYSHGKQYAP